MVKALFGALIAGFLLVGCASSEITRNDAEKNKREFSQEAYEAAMKKAGKGAELEAEKARNAAYLSGQESGQH